jgi:hypothetical protein
MRLPRTFGPWTRPDGSRRIEAGSIFDYMDGAGELYLAYGFDHLDVFEYGSADQGTVLVELYWMRTSDDAFGLLSGDWGGEPVVLEGEAVTSTTSPSPVPPHRALYGAGLLRLWSDTLYARVGRSFPGRVPPRNARARRLHDGPLLRAAARGRRLDGISVEGPVSVCRVRVPGSGAGPHLRSPRFGRVGNAGGCS